MIKTLIVDDEKKARAILHELVTANCPEIKIIGEADSITSAEEIMRKGKPDLILLDIEMPFGNGFDLLEKTSDLDYKVIFTTAYDHYAIKAIKFSALDYLLKPIDPDELKEAIERLIQTKRDQSVTHAQINNLLSGLKSEINNKPRRVAIPSFDGLLIVSTDDIIRCEADANYTRIYTAKGENVIVSKTLKDYEDLFTESNFIRVHHHNLINMDHVQKYIRGDGGYVIMTDGSSVEVSRRKKNEFLEKLAGI